MGTFANRTLAVAGATAILAASLWTSQAASQTRELSGTGEMLDGVVAVVNEGVVLRSELREQMESITERLRAQRQEMPPRHVLERQVLERLVVQQIQLQRAERLGIQVPDEMLNRALAQVAANNGISLQQLPQVLAEQGVDYNAYRREVREQMIIEQLRSRDVMQRIRISEREIDRHLTRQREAKLDDTEYNISHILVNVSSSATPDEAADAQARVDEIMSRLENGDDFSQLAVQYSDAQTALDGGELGWRPGTQLPTVFTEAVPQLSPGQHSQPIRTGGGFHIVRVNDVRGIEQVMVDQVRARHILITPDEIMDDQAVEQRLQTLRQQILDGGDFGAIAGSVSEDALSAAEGGDLGWMDPNEFVPQFRDQLMRAEIGELSEPFRSNFGWHIVEVLDRRTHDATQERQRNQAVMALRERKFEEELELWIQRLRDEAYVDYRI